MATNLITQERLKSLLTYDPDTGEFCWKAAKGTRARPNELAGAMGGGGYWLIQIDGKKHKAHRLAWVYTYGEQPDEIDHINRVKHDNRVTNLRSVTHHENSQNQTKPRNNTSGFIGVDFHKRSGKWRARIRIDGKLRDLGYFGTAEQAADCRRAAEKIYLPFRNAHADA